MADTDKGKRIFDITNVVAPRGGLSMKIPVGIGGDAAAVTTPDLLKAYIIQGLATQQALTDALNEIRQLKARIQKLEDGVYWLAEDTDV